MLIAFLLNRAKNPDQVTKGVEMPALKRKKGPLTDESRLDLAP